MKVVVGMSGGVDSSVTAAILKKQGYDVTGVFIDAYNEPGCRTDQDKQDALKVALKLGIPFQVFDLRREYKELVVKYFYETYQAGLTPNPDIVCNREVKFGLFYKWALANGFDSVATGHYARITDISGLSTKPINLLQRGADISKDQSYFLWQINPAHLKHILFPLGSMRKVQVRAKARELGLTNAVKPDSMGVCMMGELNVRDLLLKTLGTQPGAVHYQGHPVGAHQGLWFHTIGQRVGGTIAIDSTEMRRAGIDTTAMPHLFVVGKDITANRLIIGDRAQAMTARLRLVHPELRVPAPRLSQLASEGQLYLRIRNLGELEVVRELRVSETLIELDTVRPLFGVADGQAGVLYARLDQAGDEVVVAGGEISVY